MYRYGTIQYHRRRADIDSLSSEKLKVEVVKRLVREMWDVLDDLLVLIIIYDYKEVVVLLTITTTRDKENDRLCTD